MVVRSLDVNKDPFRPQEKNEELLHPKIPYLSALMYLANTTRLDISFSVNLLARYGSAPTRRHWNGIKHILRYLKGTIDMGLFYSKDCSSDLVGYADAEYLSDPHKARSQTGYVFICGGTAISWRSTKQSIVVTSSNHAEIIAIHEASRECIELPHQNTTEGYDDHQLCHPWTIIHKAVLSASPSRSSDYILTVIEGNMKFVSFWRPGDLRWTRINDRNAPCEHIHRDLVYYNGKFYAVDWGGNVLVYDVTGSNPSQTVALLPAWSPPEKIGTSDDDNDGIYGTTSFGVFEVDLAAGKLTETKELGDRALFLGANASISVQASQFPKLKPNHIYYTDDFWESYLGYEEGGGLDMGVYNLANGSFEPHYTGVSLSQVCPPIWVTPTLY
ncbi:hypothetical protein T459_10194 [Capsicum annuum]|uniref:KIB1-4 beta-propeller domain-containing protein n=1 Tax=Capsicum annuum TaxID=4072 RepID=A0A2G3A1J3_CAPAN|nr:hypothetical protein T459_10194 [Capsicum annuum]